jgi:hypothetical protein
MKQDTGWIKKKRSNFRTFHVMCITPNYENYPKNCTAIKHNRLINIYDIPTFDLKWSSSGRLLTKEKVVTNYVTAVELYCCAVGGINILSA